MKSLPIIPSCVIIPQILLISSQACTQRGEGSQAAGSLPFKIEIIKNDDIQTDLRDLPFSRNQPLKSHNDWYCPTHNCSESHQSSHSKVTVYSSASPIMQ